jgi:hypothetical protein
LVLDDLLTNHAFVIIAAVGATFVGDPLAATTAAMASKSTPTAWGTLLTDGVGAVVGTPVRRLD